MAFRVHGIIQYNLPISRFLTVKICSCFALGLFFVCFCFVLFLCKGGFTDCRNRRVGIIYVV